MSTAVLVSVVVAAYNHERFVGDALRSLIAQTYRPLELIVLDDGSTDATFARIQELLPELERRFVRVEAHAKPNEGSARTISRGLVLARGELVFLLDSDDVARPEAIERLVPLMDTPGVALAVGDNEYIDADGRPTTLEREGRHFATLLAFFAGGRTDLSVAREFGSYTTLIGGNYVPNGWLLRRQTVIDAGGYNADFVLDDWPLLVRLAKTHRIRFAGEVLAQYRIHAGNTSRLRNEDLLIDTLRVLIEEWDYCSAHALEAEWQAHAQRVFRAVSPELIARRDFLPVLFPTLDPGQLGLVQSMVLATMAAAGPRPVEFPPLPMLSMSPPPVGSLGQTIHLYALCRNDARMLPFFFRHYDPIVQRYVIFDDGSTDGSLELLRAHPRVEVRRFVWSHPDSFVLSELDHYDNCWKESRGEADWVIVADIDEHLWHPDFAGYLAGCLRQGVTVVPALGYEMISDDFPGEDERLCDTRTLGAPEADMSKLAVFSPSAVREMCFMPGGHRARPIGRIIAPPRDELVLLHYKLLGEHYPAARHAELGRRLGPTDLTEAWGYHWTASQTEVRDARESYRARMVDLSRARDTRSRPDTISRWWQDFERAQDWSGRIADLAAKLEDATVRNRQLVEELAVSLSDRARVDDYLRLSIARIAAFERSRTWRWTTPLRRVFDFLARLSGSMSS